ncbi:CDP-alcohol phosphatidyltransferase family protein [Geomicrobium sp. JCM 19039]|uniref:CDP-alcohol phosphatidyltransferase family protein n=1 Tax=Geomicrobium sp. JCM 19039 TaxID=1460636 RepID=UPI00045F3873|nr:CDP-alcohol phosphatidyltransferase family protein [Geomicrobium sp. JCM 19039]GAK11561.1 CDP-diacylglycerol-glycerol-3-phosphate 3-phosphatidyltransferase [Geomicrobium sp. JCM 19039]
MATIYDIKPKFQAMLRPLVVKLHEWNVTPNGVTVSAALLSILFGVLLYIQLHSVLLLLLPAFLLLRMMMNAIDGMLAKEHDKQTRLGMFLNELGDMVSDAALYLPLALWIDAPVELIIGIVVIALVGEAAGILAIAVGSKRRYDGPFGKSDRAFFFSVLALALYFFTFHSNAYLILLIFAFILSVATVVNRLRAALREGDS